LGQTKGNGNLKDIKLWGKNFVSRLEEGNQCYYSIFLEVDMSAKDFST
jgi:hypothetical protein